MNQTRCPSAPATSGAVVIGAVGEDGRVAHFATTLVASESFLAAARRQGAPERRFRFSTPCAEGGCAQWTGKECGLIGRITQRLVEAGAPVASVGSHPCTIRAGCRWRLQSGDEACSVCSFVITETRDDVIEGGVEMQGALETARLVV